MSKQQNIQLAEDTLKKVNAIQKERRNDYYSHAMMKEKKSENFTSDINKTVIEVNNDDVVSRAMKEVANHPNQKVAILNFASARNPGGGFLKGSVAQEESIARVSDLYLYLKDEKRFYTNPKHFSNGLYDNDVMYSHNVTFIKNNNGQDINHVRADVITSCAVNVGDLRNKRQTDLLKQVDAEMIQRIENIVELAIREGVEVLILGAFGCGVFANSGYKVKDYFQKALNSPRYKNRISRIVFSIYKDNNLYGIFKNLEHK